MIRVKNPNYSNLPSEYQEVEYLEGTGTQYIDTGYCPYKTKAEITFQKPATNSNDECLLGSGAVYGSYFYPVIYKTSGIFATQVVWTDYRLGVYDAEIHTVIYNDENNTTYYDGAPIMSDSNSDFSSPIDSSIFIFADHTVYGSGSWFNGRIYSVKLTDKTTNTLVRDFVPCYRKSDNIPGMYDLANGIFYTSAEGSGTFLIGAEVNKRDVNIKPTYQIRKMSNIIDYSNFSLSEVTFENDIFTHSASNVAMVSQTLPTPLLGHKYYGRCMQKTPSGYTFGDGRFEYYCADIAGTGLLTFGTMQDTGDEWQVLSSVQELTGEPEEGTWQLRSFSVSGSHEAYRKELMIIDLTTAFGVGKEPTKEWCDENIPFFIGDYTIPSDWESNGETINVPLKNRYVGGKLVYGEPLMNYEYRYVAVGASGNSAYSLDGETWTAMNGSGSKELGAVTYGNDRFVCVVSSGSTANPTTAYYSLDGETWTACSENGSAISYNDVTYGNGRFVRVGNNSTSDYSLDGDTWTEMSGLGIAPYSYYGVCYGNGRFVCVGGRGKSYYSLDGEAWIVMSGLADTTYLDVCYGNDRFVAVGQEGSSYYSTDGINWKTMKGLSTNPSNYRSVAYGNDRFVCVGDAGYSYYSTDGINWIAMSGLANYNYSEVTYGNGKFVCVGTYGKSHYSIDGKTWVAMTGLSDVSYNGVCCGRKAISKHPQLVNYTMLYNKGNECTDLTGGWSNTYTLIVTTTSGSYTENTDNIYVTIGSTSSAHKKAAGTENMIDTTPYKKCFINWTYSAPGKCGAKFGCGTVKNIDFESQQYSPNTLNYYANWGNGSGVSGERVINTFDLSTINQNAYFQACAQATEGNSAYFYMYNYGLVKQDDWQTLYDMVGLGSDQYDETTYLPTDDITNAEMILNSEEAVDFMIHNCTGSFMIDAINNDNFLTALENSPYSTKIYANEHWNKFLAMVV